MTEAEWLECSDPQPMLEFLQGRASERKLRLFACACCRYIWDLLTDERSKRAVQVAERYADGLAKYNDLVAAAFDGWEAVVETWGHEPMIDISSIWVTGEELPTSPASAVFLAVAEDPSASNPAFNYGVPAAASTARHAALATRQARSQERPQEDLLRCIFGNPFHSVAGNPAWLTPTVLALAMAVYEERAFHRMPELADALEEGGCTEADILAHCRKPVEHVRGCWVVDLVLGKE
jgi:hypothetical protein